MRDSFISKIAASEVPHYGDRLSVRLKTLSLPAKVITIFDYRRKRNLHATSFIAFDIRWPLAIWGSDSPHPPPSIARDALGTVAVFGFWPSRSPPVAFCLLPVASYLVTVDFGSYFHCGEHVSLGFVLFLLGHNARVIKMTDRRPNWAVLPMPSYQ